MSEFFMPEFLLKTSEKSEAEEAIDFVKMLDNTNKERFNDFIQGAKFILSLSAEKRD